MSGAELGLVLLFVLFRLFLRFSLFDWCCVSKDEEESVGVCDGEYERGGGESVFGCCGGDGGGGRRRRVMEWEF